MRVTRTKALKLIYERELRRSKPEDLDQRVKELLRRPLIDKTGKHFILEVEDLLMLDHLQALGHISDGSFSPIHVKLSVGAFVALVEDNLGDELEAVRKVLLEAGAPDKSLKGIVDAAVAKFDKRVADDPGEALIEDAPAFFRAFVDGSMDQLRELGGRVVWWMRYRKAFPCMDWLVC